MKSYGYIEPKFDLSHWVFGTLPKEVLQPDGQWDSFLPDPEQQSRWGLETDNCTGFATCNAVEMLMRRKFGLKPDYSDRFTGIIAGTDATGNDIHTVLEAARKTGFIPEIALPFSDAIKTVHDYYSFKGSSKAYCGDLAEDWRILDCFSMGHEWVYTPFTPKAERVALMKEALTLSPLVVSVSAWFGQAPFEDMGVPNNHTTVIYGWTASGWKCFDTYENDYKTVSFGHNIDFCKRIHLEKGVRKPGILAFLLGKLMDALKSHGYFTKAN